MGRTANNMKFSFRGTSMFYGKEPVEVFSWLRRFVKACGDNDVWENMGLYLISNFLAGDTDARFTRNLPRSDIAGGQGSLGCFPAAVNWLLSTYAEPHALGLAQDKFSRAALLDNEGVDAFAVCLRSLAELCGNIHTEGTMRQQLIQGVPEYLRADAFVYHTPHRSYQQLSAYVAGRTGPPRMSWRWLNGGPPGDHRGRDRRRRGPEASRSTTSTPRARRTTPDARHGRGAAIGYPGVPYGRSSAVPSAGGPDGSPVVLHVLDARTPSP